MFDKILHIQDITNRHNGENLTLYNAIKCKLEHNKICNAHVTLRQVRVTTVEEEMQQCILCVVELHVTINYMKIMSVAQHLWEVYVTCKNKMCIDIYAKCLKLLQSKIIFICLSLL